MKYWTYIEPKDPPKDFTPVYITLSEDEILEKYWDYQYNKLCELWGKEKTDAEYSKQDCIDEFVIIHEAWESH